MDGSVGTAAVGTAGAVASRGRKLFPEERRAFVLDRLAKQPKVLVTELTRQLGVSAFTVRNDLDELEAEGKLRRCHGGALPLAKTTTVEYYEKRLATASEAKAAIGAAAAPLVESGDSIVVDTGTTTLELVRNLAGLTDLTIITNDFEVALLAEKVQPSADILFLGGHVRAGYRYTYGSLLQQELEGLHVDKAFLSANGFTPEDGFTSENYTQAKIKRAYAACAAERIMLMDTGKLGAVAFAGFLDASEVDVLVTEKPIDERYRCALTARNDDIELVAAAEG